MQVSFLKPIQRKVGQVLLPYFSSSKLLFHGFHGSETKDFMTRCVASSTSVLLVLVPCAPQDPWREHGGAEVDSAHTVGLSYNPDLPLL